MSMPVSLKDIIGQVDKLPEGWLSLLNTRTGVITILSESQLDCIGAYDEGDGERAFRDVDWSEEEMLAAKEELDSRDTVKLPAEDDIDEWEIMRRFSMVQDEPTRSRLLDAIQGRGAFRFFRSAVTELGLLDTWYAFRHEAVKDEYRDFLEAYNIPFVEE